ncbi:MAG TPA: hypothetical protein VMM55_02400 [Thermohalobaculum sp.]|nr:hypothetical protein [Thermohalobaculum sp.]
MPELLLALVVVERQEPVDCSGRSSPADYLLERGAALQYRRLRPGQGRR